MVLYIFCLCCLIQPLFHYYSVYGKREILQRFIIEEGAKPAIFGSYSYDPVKQVFVPPPPEENKTVHEVTTQATNNSIVHSTAVGEITARTQSDPTENDGSTTPTTVLALRKHVTPVNTKNTAWWMRPKLAFSNFSSNMYKLNNKIS